MALTNYDYYPFGMLEPGRGYSAGNQYRYGFNGKENDNEVKGEGSQQDYGMRIYDPRLGRFLSVDPLTKHYPELTPYQFASNTPIEAIDLDGLERASAGLLLYLRANGAAAQKKSTAESTSKQGNQSSSSKIPIYGIYSVESEARSLPIDKLSPWGLKHGIYYPKDDPRLYASEDRGMFIMAGILAGAFLGTAMLTERAAAMLIFRMAGEEIVETLVENVTGIPILSLKDVSDGLGVVYRRINKKSGTAYIGQSKSKDRYGERIKEHEKANPDDEFEFEIIGTAKEGKDLNVLEETMIRKHGTPKKDIDNHYCPTKVLNN